MNATQNLFEEQKLGAAEDVSQIKKLVPFLRPYQKLFAWTLVLIVLITGTEMSIPYITKIVIDRYIVPGQSETPDVESADGRATRFLKFDLSDARTAQIAKSRPQLFRIENNQAIIPYEKFSELPENDMRLLRKNDLSGVAWAVAWLLGIVIISFFLNFINMFVMEYAGQMMMHDLRMEMFSHIQRLSVRFFTRNPVGRLVTRVTSDTQNMHEMFTSVLVFVIKDLFMLTAITMVLFSIDWRLSLAVYAVFPFVFFAAWRFTTSARQAFRTLRVKIAEINTKFSESIGGMQVVQLFRQEDANYRSFQKINREHYDAGMQQITVFALFMPLMEMMSSVALAIVIFYGGGRLIDGRISLGTLVVFISYIRMFFRPIRDIAEKYNITLNALSSMERMFQILDDKTMIPEPPADAAARMPDHSLSFSFDDVSFSYVPGEKVLDGISLYIRAGETISIVGQTGAGKTSLVNLMMRFYDPDSGVIRVNGTDIRQFKLADLRSGISIVTQDPYIFSTTIRNNIFPETNGFTDREMDEILDAAYCRHFIDRLPQGLDTLMTEGGASLSSGERQLLSIARALAHGPDLIIFDEATSYVDSETEMKIQNALGNLMKNRTAVIIAHRLSTARTADRIVVMHGGRIIETGTHEALMEQKGFYYRLHQFQG
ncbi:MAG: ABC transporter ATP-binding protein [Desulfosalsimonadaceae bacterium]